MKKVLITGGNGFIARNFREQCDGEYDISAPGRAELDLLDHEKVLEYIKSKKFDVVIHAATYDAAPAHSGKDPSKVLENNLKMFFNVARCSKYFGKMIYFGSGAEFDRNYWVPKMKEDYFDKHVPQDQYGLSKYIMTKYAMSSDNIYNLRLFASFGKYEDWKVRLTSSVCYYATRGQPVIINQNKKYDFLYINDLVRIIRWFIENNPKYNVYNVCTSQPVDFLTIAKKAIRFSGKKLAIEVKTKGLGKEYSGDNTLLLKEIKGFKFTHIDDSLKELYTWIEKNIDKI